MNSKLTLYEKLELLPPNSLQPGTSTMLIRRLSRLIRQLWQLLLLPPNEPRLTQAGCSQTGEPLFNGYDPTTRQGIRRVSEIELRIWLEQRYRHSQRDANADSQLWLGLRQW